MITRENIKKLAAVSAVAVVAICGFEGYREYAYKDVAGVPTIGYGTSQYEWLIFTKCTVKPHSFSHGEYVKIISFALIRSFVSCSFILIRNCPQSCLRLSC